jgi:hypothetical protein
VLGLNGSSINEVIHVLQSKNSPVADLHNLERPTGKQVA